MNSGHGLENEPASCSDEAPNAELANSLTFNDGVLDFDLAKLGPLVSLRCKCLLMASFSRRLLFDQNVKPSSAAAYAQPG
jgi:hypothetical protein